MASFRDNMAGVTGVGDYILKHWTGGFSLGFAVWVNTVLVAVAFEVLCTLVGGVLGVGDLDTPRAIGIPYFLILTCIDLVSSIWQLVGVGRSASLHVERGGKSIWASLARCLVVLGVVGMVAGLYLSARDFLASIG
ncbi:MAG: conserved rane protein of unknown function [Rubritepida sp.]|nr:conserved rane protein of unknown function [Rubritepida sp.]